MAIAKMTVADLERFLHVEFPQAFSGGDISIESADGVSCLLRQRYSDQMLRPGGTLLGPAPMGLAAFAVHGGLLSASGPGGLPGSTHLSLHFRRKVLAPRAVFAALGRFG